MATFFPILKRPSDGRIICPQYGVFDTGAVCGAFMPMRFFAYNISRVAIDFNGLLHNLGGCTDVNPRFSNSAGGSGMTNNSCGMTTWNASRLLDLWGAWYDGEWTSSVTSQVFGCKIFSDSPASGIATYGYSVDGSLYNGHTCKNTTVALPSVTCPTTLIATFTFYEDGTATVA